MLGEVCEIIMGQAPSGESYNENGEGYPLIAGAGDFKNGVITPKKYTTAPTKLSKKDDIVMSIRASIGDKVWCEENFCLGRGVSALRPKKDLDKKYLWHALTEVEKDLIRKGRGATFLQVSKDDIKDLIILLPPLTEQQRIAEILDKVALVKRKRELAIEKLDGLGQSIYRRNFGNSSSIKLEEICSFQNGGTPSKEVSEYWAGDIAWISSADIVGSKIQYGRNFITTLGVDNSATNIAPKGTILIVTRTGVGKVAVTDRPTAFSQDIVSITLKKGFDINFVCEALKNNLPYFLSHARGATIQGITRSVLASALIPKVDEGGQNIFGKIISAINGKNHLFIKSLGDIESLGSSLQSKAFSGQL